ncbi:NEDD8-conjugating enzyme Ubc12-like [Oopsacas minuta]|uniref:NEDD8-conjugating enzyme Ubc12-like n=1 Tax=Oopsacas minuta TaxID=111878 RepID=A0AAV7KAW7_9METZ|nr:NEDD8-conjugating enzyme Ubc12-like [Oopsacas minuta]
MPQKKSIPQQLSSLIKNIEKTSNGQASVDLKMLSETDNPECIFIHICPKEGPYKYGTFVFEIQLGNGYPINPPAVSCHTSVYHPNIDFDVCLSMLDEWTGDMDLEDIVMGLLFLMQNPQIDDPLNLNFRGDEKYPDFVRKVRKSLKGQLKDSSGHVFERNWHKPENSTPSDSESEELVSFSPTSLPSTPIMFDNSGEYRAIDSSRHGHDSNNLLDYDGRNAATVTLNTAINIAILGVVTVCVSTFIIYKCLKKGL